MEFELIRSARKTLALEVRQTGEIVVRAPQRMPEKQIRAFVQAHQNWIARARARQAERLSRHPEPDAQEEAMLRQRAQAYLPELTWQYAKLMNVTPASVRITSARTRFGSCSGRNGIAYSWRLMQYPQAAIEYVVVHELAHITHHDHSAAFWQRVAEFMPDYRERRALLK